VEWFNSVDATYRDNLRELNEIEFRARQWQARGVQRHLGGTLYRARAKLEHEWRNPTRSGTSDRRARTELVKELADVKGGLKWIYAFWAPTALAVIGTGAGVIGLLLRR